MNQAKFEVGEPNWEPLEALLSMEDCEDFMYMGTVGDIELYKHRHTRRYLNICGTSGKFYRYAPDRYIEISRVEALSEVLH